MLQELIFVWFVITVEFTGSLADDIDNARTRGSKPIFALLRSKGQCRPCRNGNRWGQPRQRKLCNPYAHINPYYLYYILVELRGPYKTKNLHRKDPCFSAGPVPLHPRAESAPEEIGSWHVQLARRPGRQVSRLRPKLRAGKQNFKEHCSSRSSPGLLLHKGTVFCGERRCLNKRVEGLAERLAHGGITVPTFAPFMITSRSDHIHCRRASMCAP